MSTFLSCCGLLLLTARSAASITSEKERDSWVSLISTPLEAGQIVKAKVLGSLWSLRGLVPFLAVVWLPALLLRPSCFWGIAFSLLDLGILAAFAATLGVYCSQSSKSTLRAMGAALGTVILVGGGYLLCCCPVGVGIAAVVLATDGHSAWRPACRFCWLCRAWPAAMTARFSDRECGGLMAAYLIGTIGYAVAAGMMLVAAIKQFDEKSGRTRGRSGYSPRPRPPSSS